MEKFFFLFLAAAGFSLFPLVVGEADPLLETRFAFAAAALIRGFVARLRANAGGYRVLRAHGAKSDE